MQLTLTEGDEGADPVVIYEGLLIDEMESALFAHADAVGGRYARNVRRWWTSSAKENVEEGLEPVLVLFNGPVLNTWKAHQTPIGS
jgi:hypothetical protein